MKIKEFRYKSIVAQLWKEELSDSYEPCIRMSFSRIQKVKDGSGNTYVRDGFRPGEIKDVARLIKTVHKWLDKEEKDTQTSVSLAEICCLFLFFLKQKLLWWLA